MNINRCALICLDTLVALVVLATKFPKVTFAPLNKKRKRGKDKAVERVTKLAKIKNKERVGKKKKNGKVTWYASDRHEFAAISES